MKIGLSYSRCIRDIIDGNVDMDDVLVLITRTDFNPENDSQWKSIWEGYHWQNPEWASYPDEDEARFRQVTIDLYKDGKMHQPRQYGAWPTRLPYIWLETVLPSEELSKNPGTKAAWDKFQTVAALSGVDLDESHSA